MEANYRNKWLGGIICPCIALVWGVSSLISGQVVIPIRQSRFLPLYSHISVHGWPAMCLSVALISVSVAMHCGLFWGQYPKWQRPASLIALCTAWIAGTLFAIGTIAFSIKSIVDF